MSILHNVTVQPCGMVAQHDSVLGTYPLTPCCKASAKGSGDSVVCRGCYAPVSDLYGTSGYDALYKAAQDVLCPCPGECADYVLYDGYRASQDAQED